MSGKGSVARTRNTNVYSNFFAHASNSASCDAWLAEDIEEIGIVAEARLLACD